MGGSGRAPCCDKSQVKRGPWSPAEDSRLISFIQKHGHANWRSLPKQAGLARCGKSCRLRWINYLRPDLKRGNFTNEEEESIIKLQEAYGNKWSKIASYFPGRTDNEIKNVWNTHLKKRSSSKSSNRDVHESKELSSITNSNSSSSSSSSSATFHLSSGKPIAEAKARLENQSNIVEVTDDQIRVDDTACNLKLTMNSSFSSYDEPQIIDKEGVFEIPLESDYDFWNMLDGTLVPFQRSNVEPLVLPQEDHIYYNPKLDMIESEKWLSYLDLDGQQRPK